MSKTRIKIIAIVGAKSFSCEIKSVIGRSLTEKWGGCFISRGDGFWSSEGNNFQDDYAPSSVMQEESLKIELTVMPSAEHEAINSICKIMSEVKDKNMNHFRFVHVEKIQCTADHQDLRLILSAGTEDKI